MRTVVVTINYNNPVDTERCISSLLRYSPNVQIVVVDNASKSGDIGAVVGGVGRKNIHLLESPENLGFGRGNNLGMRWAQNNLDFDYFLLLNNDTEIDSDVVGMLEEYMDEHPEISGCSPRIVYAHDPNLIWYGGGELKWSTHGAVSWNINKLYDGDVQPREVTFISGCVMMLRRSVVQEIGGFDPRYFMYAEDIEYCARLVSRKKKLAYLPGIVVLHRAHGSIRSEGVPFVDPESAANPHLEFYLENCICNILLNLDTYGSRADKLVGGLFLVLKWGRKGVSYIAHGKFGAIRSMIKGIASFINLRRIPYFDELKQRVDL